MTVLSVVVAAILSSCSDSGSALRSGESTSAGQAAQQLVGSRWTLIEVTTRTGSLSVPESLEATWQFTADHEFLASDTVNAISGEYRATPTGFETVDARTTLVGYAGSDPVRLAVIAAFEKMTSEPVHVERIFSATTVTMQVPGYRTTFRRSGPAATFPPASPTPTASH